jgi:hypothetical protein
MVIFAWFSTQRVRRCFPDHLSAAATVGIAAPCNNFVISMRQLAFGKLRLE